MPSPRILFVDDEPFLLAALRRSLRSKRGEWETHFACGGAEAIATFEQTPFDVVVSDMRMPGMDGATLAAKLSQTNPDHARIILSGQTGQTAILSSVGVVHQFLSKPCTPKILAARIDGICSRRRAFPNTRIRAAISSLRRLPVAPNCAARLSEELNRKDTCLQRVEAIVNEDTGLSAMLLQAGLACSNNRETFSASDRARRLGVDQLRTLAESTDMFAPATSLPRDFDFETLAATNGRETCTSTRRVGIAALAAAAAEEYQSVLSRTQLDSPDLCEIEREILGVDHRMAGTLLQELWGIRETVETGSAVKTTGAETT